MESIKQFPEQPVASAGVSQSVNLACTLWLQNRGLIKTQAEIKNSLFPKKNWKKRGVQPELPPAQG